MIKFTDIRRNANVLLEHKKETAIIKHSQVVGYIVPVERMNELLAAEEQFENGYMAQPIIVDLAVGDIKAGDTVRIKSLDKTHHYYGVVDGMFDVGTKHVVSVVIGSCVSLDDIDTIYHIDDLELVK